MIFLDSIDDRFVEAAAVISIDGEVIHWHCASTATETRIDDDRNLWQILWNNRQRLGGVAHTHPGRGMPTPSLMDLSTIKAIEKGLGRTLRWWIVSADAVIVANGCGPWTSLDEAPPWIAELRARSKREETKDDD